MDPIKIIDKYYQPKSKLFNILLKHSRQVSRKALYIASRNRRLSLDLQFIQEAAMLHDIGIVFTEAPDIDCHGPFLYLCHGYLGGKLLRKEGLIKHALVTERHTGVGLTKKEILQLNLPIPKKDYFPETHEEKIISLADKFYTKNPKVENKQLSISHIRKNIARFGSEKLEIFDQWCREYGIK